ncbi:hypothetical protein EDD68_13124 [Melghiribacillus thermohalophilus]|uniref:Uncharacterized protein n=1 Tax=Melghiribacillus thermohalophilus TaxID=1324956 RepID=A0A4R3MPP0_9BACI|nr:hypothetical protein EDD68_13124 [Melghiribacillus thermohalophilus]
MMLKTLLLLVTRQQNGAPKEWDAVSRREPVNLPGSDVSGNLFIMQSGVITVIRRLKSF